MTAVQQALEWCFADLIDHDETQKVKFEYRQRYRTVVVEYTNRSGEHELHPMYEMSDGYRSVLSMVGRYCAQNGDFKSTTWRCNT